MHDKSKVKQEAGNWKLIEEMRPEILLKRPHAFWNNPYAGFCCGALRSELGSNALKLYYM